MSVACRGSERQGTSVVIAYARLSLQGSERDSYRAIQLAVDRLNREAGGRLVFEAFQPDHLERDPVRVAAQLRSNPQVIGVVGPLLSQDMLEAVPEFDSPTRGLGSPVVAVAPIGTNPALTDASEWLFRLPPTDRALAAAAARFAFDSLRSRRAVILMVNDAFGNDWSRIFQAGFESAGGHVIARERSFAGDSTEWDLYFEYVRKLNPDLLVLPSIVSGMAWWVLRLRARGVNTPILAGDAFSYLDGTPTRFSAFHYVGFYDHDNPATEHGRWFVNEYERVHGDRARQIPAFAYDGALAIGRAVLTVGADRARVRAYLAQLGRERPAIEGATGMIAFDAGHDRIGAPILLKRLQ